MEYFSDDSSFYGDESIQRELEHQAAKFDVLPYWEAHPKLINVMAAGAAATNLTIKAAVTALPTQELHNPLEGDESGRQLGETALEFTQRAPVLSSLHLGPWLWVANPYAGRIQTPEQRQPEFLQRAQRLMHEYLAKKSKIAGLEPDMVAGTVTRKLKPDRDRLKEEILQGAKKNGMTSGKWMLFPSLDHASETWLRVVEAVIANKLGTAAKIATDGDTRLICIYTKDFSDLDDVRRVLEAMVDLGFTSKDAARGIYYKCDAFTHLDIMANNDYGLAASLYASKELLGFTAPKKPANQTAKQKRLSDGASLQKKEPSTKRARKG